jgi:two-component system, sensor histidine kinase PdtaS
MKPFIRHPLPICFLLLLSGLCSLSVRAQDWHLRDSLLRLLDHSGQDTSRIALLLKLAEFEVFKAGEYKTDLDSAAVYIEAAKTLNTKVQSPQAAGWVVLAESYLLKERPGQRLQGKAYAEKALAMLQQGNDPFHTANAYHALSDYYDEDDTAQRRRKIALLENSVALYRSAGAIWEEADGYQLLGELYETDSLELSSLERALALFQSIHYPLLQGVYGNLAVYYYQKSNFKQGINYAITALKTADDQHDTTMQLCELANQIAIMLNRQGQYEQAIPYFFRALERAEAYHENYTTYVIAANIATTFSRLNQPLKAKTFLEGIIGKYEQPKDNATIDYRLAGCFLRIYVALADYNRARPHAEKLKLLLEKNIPTMGLTQKVEIHFTLTNYYLATRQIKEAAAQLKSNDPLVAANGDPVRKATNEYLWFQLDTAQGRYADAVRRLLKSKEINDSIFNATKSQQIHQLEVEFDTKKKEDQIRLLNQDARLEKVNLQQANLLKNVSFGGVFLALVIAGLLFRQNRIKQKNSRLILEKNGQLEHLVKEREWLLKEVHHRVKNNLYTVICLLESQATYLENDALLAVQNSGHRIYAMSLIHQKLYQTEDIGVIDMKSYITEFVYYLKDSFGSPSNIRIGLEIEPLSVAVAHAIPLGLIINESVTNAFKYAFPRGQKGLISVRLFRTGRKIVLTIADDGKGFDYKPDDSGRNSFGMGLMEGLTREIRGTFSLNGTKGTTVTVSFEMDLLDAAV